MKRSASGSENGYGGVWAPRFRLRLPRSHWASTPRFLTRVSSQTRLRRRRRLARIPFRGGHLKIQPSVIMSGGPAMMTPNPALMMRAKPTAQAEELPVEGVMPSLSGAVAWLNSPPLTAEALKGKVVLVDFWTYSCINCLRAIPYVRAWAEKRQDRGLVVIGVHDPGVRLREGTRNVSKARVRSTSAIRSQSTTTMRIWRAFSNRSVGRRLFIGADGRVRHHRSARADYDGSQRVIQQLPREAGKAQPVR